MSLSKNSSKLIMKIISIGLFIMLFFNLFASESNEQAQLNKLITLDVEDGSIAHVLSTMAKLGDCNIVLSMDVSETSETDKEDEKKVTVHLNSVPLEQALNLVVKAVGLSYRLIGDNTFLVGDKAKINEEMGERSYLINLNYVDVNTVVAAIGILPGEAVPVEGQNALLLRANPVTYAEISNRIKEIDVPQQQIEIRARLIEINVTESEKFGIDWSKLNSFTTIIAEDPVNGEGVGLPYNFTDITGQTPYGETTELGVLPDDQYWQKMESFDDAFRFSRQLTAFDITIDWLLENNAAQLLTDTRLTALNGEEAEIHIGEEIPYVGYDEDKEVTYEREEVGIKLKVQPTVNSDGQITTTIMPEVSSVLELVKGYIPRTKVRRVNTTVTVADGDRIIVGGLLNSTITQKVNKVPFLGDLPWIGKLFRHRSELVNNTDLIIEITPRIVSKDDLNPEFKIDERLERKLIETENN